LSIFFISIMIVSNRERILRLILSLVHPDHRQTWELVLGKMWRRMGRYIRAKLIVMTIIGAITYGALLILDVRFPLLLAIIVAVGELVPRIGVWFARVPLFLIAAIDGVGLLVAVYIMSVIIENMKGYVISPFVEGDQLNIHPLPVFISVLVGGTLLGVAGAFIAVPAAAMLQVVFEEVILPWRQSQFVEAEESGVDEQVATQPQEPETIARPTR
ncbi:MAG: AI-2E family transporter, partial [Chloroflexota bacterium]